MANFIKCPSCGKQYNKDAFDKCPFCGTSLYAGNSADDVLNDFSEREKVKQESQRRKILSYFKIDGDVTDEQYEELNKKYNQIYNKNNSLFTPNAESILNKYGTAIKAIGLILMFIFFIIAVVYFYLAIEYDERSLILTAVTTFIIGIIAYITCIVLKAFIDVFVNISVTLQEIKSQNEE